MVFLLSNLRRTGPWISKITSYMDVISFYSAKDIPSRSIYFLHVSSTSSCPPGKQFMKCCQVPLSLHTEFLPLFENTGLLREIWTWGRESSWQVQYLASKVGSGEQQLSCLPKTFCNCSVTRWCVIVKKRPLTGLEFVRSVSSNWGTLLVAQLVEALRYKPEGRKFDSRWFHQISSLT